MKSLRHLTPVLLACMILVMACSITFRWTCVPSVESHPKVVREAKQVKFIRSKPERVAEVDLRAGKPAHTISAKCLDAVESLKQEVPGVAVEFDLISGSPSYVQATGRFLSKPLAPGQSARTAVEQFIERHINLFGHDASALKQARVTREDRTQHSGLQTLVWNQEVDGVPVFHAILKANVSPRGEVVTINDYFLPDPIAATRLPESDRKAHLAQPVVSATRAVTLAAASLSDAVPEHDVVADDQPQGAEQRQRFTAPGVSDTTARLTYLPMDADTLELAWDVTTFSLAHNEMFNIIVHASSGQVLRRTSLTTDISDATYRVYADGTTKTPLDNPLPMLPGTPTPSGAQGTEVLRNLITLPALDTTASPNGWINDGGTETVGNNVDAHTDTNADNVADLPRPSGGATRVFDFACDLTLAPSAYKDAAVTHLFYLNNWMHDKLYGLGFTETAGNFQTDNFGRGGSGNDAVQADAQDGSGTNNANFSTPTDGSAGRMQMYVFTGPNPDRDGDFDNIVVLHEYTHGLSNRLVGGGVGMSASQSRGMGEGWSDFYGLALLADPASDPNAVYPGGSYATLNFVSGMTSNYYYGIRRYPYSTDMAKNPLTFRDIDPTQASAHTGIPLSPLFASSNSNPSEVHNQGEVWCMALWECRARLMAKHGGAIGNQKILQLTTDGMKLAPLNPNMLQARDAILQADLVSTGGADVKELWAAFAKRGMGLGATSPASSTTTGITENFDIPDALSVTPLAPLVASGTRLTGPFSPTSATFTLSNIGTASLNWTASKTQPWATLSATSGTLGVGGSATITATLDAAQLQVLAAGSYTETFTFTNTSNGAVMLRTLTVTVNPYLTVAASFDLNSDPGWSRQGEWAYGTPTGGGAPYADPTSGATGSKVFGINLNGAYNTNTSGYAYLTAGPFNLTGVTNAQLRFSRWLNVAGQTSVYNTVDVSTNGSSWTNIWNNGTTTIQESAWSTQTYPMGAAVDNQSTVFVRWGHSVATAGTTARGGWNLDDIQILGSASTANVTALPQAFVTPLNTPVILALAGADSSDPGAPLTFTVTAGPSNGSLAGAPEQMTYTPNTNFFGMDSFTYTASNGTETSAPAIVTVQVQPGPPEVSVEQPLGTVLTDGASTIAFGSVLTGATAVKQFVIKNLGTGPLTTNGITIDGTYAAEFTAGTLSSTVIQPGSTAYVNVTFRPAFVGSKTATLHLASDDADEPGFDVALIGTGNAAGGGVTLVKDINALPAGLTPSNMVTIGGTTYFSATTIDLGTELWKTDGTPAGTVLVKDINSGNGSSSPLLLTNVNGTLFFSANTSTSGTELWKSDGTSTGTVMVKEIASTSSSSNPTNFAVIGSTLYFSATDLVNGIELWKSDGTTGGTVMVKDINAGSANSTPFGLTNMWGTLFFMANDGVNGTELWKSDGTTGGTVMVKDINAGTGSITLTQMIAVGSTLFMSINDGVNGTELWKSDGTAGGTVLVKDIFAGSSSSTPSSLVNLNGTLLFAAADSGSNTELWKSDGTTAGTVMVKDILPGTTGSFPSNMLVVGSTVYFSGADALSGRELWQTDGTAAGTLMVKDLNPGISSSNPGSLVLAGSTIYFTAIDAAAGLELWKSDGTAQGTMLVKDINPGIGSGPVSSMVAQGSSVIFSGNDGLNGPEPWRSDGTAAGTVMLLDGVTGTQSAAPGNLRSINGLLYFSATDGSTATEPWRSDGTSNGTVIVKDVASGASSSSPSGFTNLGSIIYFAAADSSTGTELWRTDGSANGTALVKDILSGSSGSSPGNLTAVGSTLFFSANDGTNGAELWKSDGTTVGTVLVKDINPTANTGSTISNAVSFNGQLFFSASDGVNGTELWKSDGTSVGTTMVLDINSGSVSSSPSNLRVVGSTLFFTATTAANGTELWKTDGTTLGTVLVSDIVSGATSSSPANLTAMGGLLYFTATTSAAGTELWKSDGSTVGTVMVKDIFTGTSSSGPQNFAVVGSTLFFSAIGDNITGRELWKSDGTAGGTVLVRDIHTTSGFNSNPASLVAANGLLFFAATNATNGTELWKSDGTFAGTTLVTDLLPGTANSNPTNLTVVGNQVFFTARGTDLGASELFVVDAGAAAEIAVEQPAGTGLTDGVSTVDFGTLNVGGLSVTKTFVVQNLGGQPLTITGVTIDGIDASAFTPVLNYSGTVIAAGSSTTLSVVFNTTTAGSKSAALHIGCTDADENPFDIALIGTAVAAPEIAIEQPAGTDRGSGIATVMIGDAPIGLPVTQTFTVRNGGTAALHVSGITVDGANAADFSVSAITSATIATSGSATFDVILTPSAAGSRRAAIHVLSDDADEASFNITVAGLGSLAQGPLKLARDINSQGAPGGITTMAMLGTTLIFTANDPTTGTELWKSDGSPSGTVLLKDIFSGTTSSNPGNFLAVGSVLFFTANDGTNGTELWKTDGTPAGTVLVKDVNGGTSSSSPSLLTNVAGTLYFIATDVTTGTELWKSDGTTAGTVQVKDIVTGTSSSSITQLTAMGSTLFFTANDGTNGTELWKSDGTSTGTVMVKDVYATAGQSSSPSGLTVMGSTLYFSATDGSTGVELWKSDGTSTGTAQVADIVAGSSGSSPAGFVVSGSTLFFRATTTAAGTELWKSDGTTLGTVLVKDIVTGSTSSTPSSLLANGFGGIWFLATDSTNGTELWKSDGSANGTSLVMDINPGIASSSPTGLTLINGVLYFSATTATSGTELWRSDGTPQGTAMVREMNPGTLNATPLLITSAGGGSFFFLGSNGADGIELWRTDGTGAGTFMIKDIVPGTASSGPALLRAMNGAVLFSASDGVNGAELWSSDGTTTTLVKDINAGSGASSISVSVVIEYTPSDVSPTIRTLYFSATDGVNGAELWKSDGTAAGTTMVKDINPGPNSSSPSNLTNVSGRLFFTATDGTNGTELWTSDGTSAGTVMVANIAAGSTNSSPFLLTAVGSTLFFAANDAINGTELWKSDGTAAGTSLVKDLTPGSTSTSFSAMAACNGQLFFVANDGQGAGAELWTSDGSAAGTVFVKDINPGSPSASISSLTAWNGVLYFAATDGVNGIELWRSDGTANGTWMLRDIAAGSNNSTPTNLLVFGNQLVFSAFDSVLGTELWKTDGTAAGTVLIKDINPGSTSSSPSQFANVNGLLYFSATCSTTQGAELWRSDGTANGTALVSDLRPASGFGSSPGNFTALGTKLFFSAAGTDTGTELWVLDTTTAPEIAVFEGASTAGSERQDGIGAFSFGNVSTPVTQSFTIKNSSTTNLYVNDIVATGANAASFIINGKPDTTTPIALNGTATFTVTAQPTALGTLAATISILSNDADESSFDIAVSATVPDTTAPVISAPSAYRVGQPGMFSMPLPDLRKIVTYTDNVASAGTITQTPAPDTTNLTVGQSVSVSFTATDAAGNVSNTVSTLVSMGLGQTDMGSLVTATAGTGVGSDAAAGDPTAGITKVLPLSDGGWVVGGKYASSFTLGTGADQVTLALSGSTDVFIARYRPNGTLVWARKGGGTLSDWLSALTVLSDDSIVAGGGFSTSITFGTTTLTGNTTTDFFMVRYLADGTLSWSKAVGGTGTDYIHNLIELTDGSIAAVGVYGSTAAAMSFGNSVTISNIGSAGNDFWIAKFNHADGLAQWARTAGSATAESTSNFVNLVALPGGAMAMGSSFNSSPLTFTGSAITLSNAGTDLFAAKYDSSGTLVWAKRGTGAGTKTMSGMAALANGDVAIAGTTIVTTTFGSGESSPATLTPLGSGADVIYAAFNGSTGNLRWASHGGSTGTDTCLGLTVLPDNSLAIAGTFTAGVAQFGIGEAGVTTITGVSTISDIFVAKVRADTGTLLWAKSASGSQFDGINAITALSDGDVGIAGTFNSPTIRFGAGEPNATTLTSASTSTADIYVAKLSRSDGSLLWAKRGGGTGIESVHSLACMTNGNAVLAGTFQPSPVMFGEGEPNQTTLTNADSTGSNTDLCLAVFNAGGALPPAAPLITPQAATGLSASTMTFNAAINSQGLATTVLIDYGPTTSYGTQVSVAALSAGLGAETRSVTLTGLPALTTRHFRVTATNTVGTSVSSDVAVTTYSDAEIAVEQPTGVDLTDNVSAIDFGIVPLSSSATRTITIRNVSLTGTLTGLARSIDGVAAADFSATTLGTTSLAPGASTTIDVTVTPTANGPRSAMLHFVSNDGNESPFDIALVSDNAFATTFNSANDVPVSSNGFNIPTGRSLVVNLGFAPSPGTVLKVIDNTGSGPISGTFYNLPQSGMVSATFNGQTYLFQIRYDGGDGNDVTLGESFEWLWRKGSTLGNQTGTYGTLNVAANSNTPGGRTYPMTWTDAGGTLWLFGGLGYSGSGTLGSLNDLWKYNKTTSQWTWLKGSNVTANLTGTYGTQGVAASTNLPGSRSNGATWADNTGRLWLFGGNGYSATSNGNLNDLWSFNTGTAQWTWVGGSNAVNANGTYGTQGVAAPGNNPGARNNSARWTDSAGNLWLFGGYGVGATGTTPGYLNDLWKFDVTLGQWVWMKGSSSTSPIGTYGVQGTPNAANTPGGRYMTTAVRDLSGFVWLFSGTGYGASSIGILSDVWRYDAVSNNWTWISGTTNPTLSNGSAGLPAQFSSAFAPSGRQGAQSWIDTMGRVWFFGGFGYGSTGGTTGSLSDLWCFDVNATQWAYMRGARTIGANGSYGSPGVPAVSNAPGGRDSFASFQGNGPATDLWLFGGNGLAATGATSTSLNDLWMLDLPAAPTATTTAASNIGFTSVVLNASVNPNGFPTTVRFRYGNAFDLSGAAFSAGQALTGMNTLNASESISGLTSGTTYYFQVVSESFGGSSNGAILSFTTPQSPDISIEQPAGTSLVDGAASIVIGSTATSQTISTVFTLKNTGPDALASIAATLDGSNAGDFAVSGLPATLAANGNTTFTVSFTPNALGARNAALHVTSNDPDEASFDISLTGTGLSATDAWRIAHFGTASNAGDAADDADPDHDGIKNLIEFAFNSDPTTPSPTVLPTVTTTVNPTDNKHYLTLTYRRRITPDSMTCEIQTSHDLVTWTTVPNAYLEQVGTATATGDGITELVTFRVLPAIEDDPTPCFVHIAVSP